MLNNSKLASGLLWTGIEKYATQIVTFVITIIIARILSPSDYGLIAMLSIFIAIAQTFIESGFSDALIHHNKIDDEDFCTAFYLNIGISILFYFFLFFLAPLISSFFDEPILEGITKIICLSLVVNAFTIVQRAKMCIELNFKTQAYISVISAITSGFIAIILAYNGFGVWSLVIQTLLSSIISTILYLFLADWNPSLRFSLQSLKKLYGFGFKLLIGGLLHVIYNQLYVLLIGKYYSTAELGYYSRASSFPNLTSVGITQVLIKVFYPYQCSIKNELDKLEKSQVNLIRISSCVIFPIILFIVFFAEPLILSLLTERWIKVVPFLMIISLSYLLYPVQFISWQYLKVIGRTDLVLKSEVVKKIGAIIILVSTLNFSVEIMCWGLVLYSILDVAIIHCYLKKVSNLNFKVMILNIYPFLMIALFSNFCAVFFTSLFTNTFIQLLIGFIIMSGCTILTSKILKLREYFIFKDLIITMLSKSNHK